jgi:uncharacterized membrane protein YfcA
MICAMCHCERPSGREYHFFYRTKGPTQTYRDYSKMQKVTTTSYKIAGQAAVWIREGCVTRQVAIEVAPAFLLAAMIAAAAVGSALESNTANVVVCSGMALILVGFGIYMILTGRPEFGEKAAISSRRSELRGQGHNAFLTTKQFKNMQSSGT